MWVIFFFFATKTVPKQVIAVTCGTSHSAVALASGDVYTFGCGTEGRLGLGDESPRYAPTRVEGLANIKVSF
jgi:alpha-tubulin suppressor-like RCC1 family protein